MKNKKKILFLMPSFGCGGVESTFLSLLNTIDRNKYEITLMLIDKKGDFFNKLPSDVLVKDVYIPERERGIFFGKKNILLSYLKKLHFLKAIRFYRYNMKFSLSENRTKNYQYFKQISHTIPIVKEEYDLAIDYFGYASFTTFYLAEKIQAKKKVSWLHSIMSRFDPKAFEECYKKIDIIYACSKMVKEDFETIFPSINNVQLFYNIINPLEIKEKANLKGGFNDKYEGIRILTVGRICHEKGIDVAAKTYNLLKKNGYNIRWYIIGNGSNVDINKIKKILLKKEDFVFLGIKDNPFVYMKQCDIYVQPSRFEGYCTTTNEARIVGCPIVMTNVSGANEQVINGVNGYIVEGSVTSLYNAITTLIDSNEIRKKFKENLKLIDYDTRNEVNKLLNL
ncbi:MAG: glycosyltransferase [Thomasclavelia spiroformis]|uniref:glycosyltransferase n=1 Tax=Thomasclavelia spiroformis TaxID=29348 RepID=UPI00399079D5